MTKCSIVLAVGVFALLGCSGKPESVPAEETKGLLAPAEVRNDEGDQITELEPIKIGPYEVSANYEGSLTEGHFNLNVTGPEFVAIRQWVGTEDASGVLVSKAEVMADHIHAGVEMPDPLPAGARFWIEIEMPGGERIKGSMPLQSQ